MPKAEDANLIEVGHEAIEREIARLPERNDQFANLAVSHTADQRVFCE